MTSNQEKVSKPIDEFPYGSFVRVIHIDSGKSALSRFCALGLTPGTKVQVFVNGKGPIKLKFRDSEIALGRKFAHKILAMQVEEDD
ncbi:MAG: ferrous iron transport protein A [Desulfonatronovibrio sp.]|nr:ferrous iron transport protein A [Desulfovibrionales bacterium]